MLAIFTANETGRVTQLEKSFSKN